MTSKNNPHLGTTLDAFLAEDGIREAAKAEALTRVVAWQLRQERDFAASCQMSLDGQPAPVRLVRGDVTAEFAVEGRTSGQIELVTPEPIITPHARGRSVGLAVPLPGGFAPSSAPEKSGDWQ